MVREVFYVLGVVHETRVQMWLPVYDKLVKSFDAPADAAVVLGNAFVVDVYVEEKVVAG